MTGESLKALATHDHYPAVLKLFQGATGATPPMGRILDVPAGHGAFAQETHARHPCRLRTLFDRIEIGDARPGGVCRAFIDLAILGAQAEGDLLAVLTGIYRRYQRRLTQLRKTRINRPQRIQHLRGFLRSG